MAQQISITEDAVAHASGDTVSVLSSDLAYKRLAIVNVVLVGLAGAGDRGWVLIDAGVIGSKSAIKHAAEERFGVGARPAAIVMTHGHFDHVGVLEALAAEWDTPVWAHPLERPYLDGSAAYPPADPSVGGGLMTLLSPLYPTKPRGRCGVPARPPGGRERTAFAGLAVGAHARPLPWPRLVCTRGRHDRWRRFRDHGSGVRLCGDGPGTRNPRAAQIFHPRLANRPHLRSDPRSP